MRGLMVALSLLIASTGQAEQIEAEVGAGLIAGMMAGNVARGTLWMGSAF